MNTAGMYCEVVWIMNRNRLVDSESYERIYGSSDNRTPESGYYIARSPAGTTYPHFLHDGLSFIGPYASRHDASAALAAALHAVSDSTLQSAADAQLFASPQPSS